MEQRVIAALQAYGMDVAGTTARFGGNENLLLKYLRRFPADPSFCELCAAMQAEKREAVKAACHTLKGVTGTLGLTPLYNAASDMMAMLRQSDDADVTAPFAAVQEAYHQAIALVQTLETGA